MKVHKAVKVNGYYWTLCSKQWIADPLLSTSDESLVTCRKCLKIMNKAVDKFLSEVK